jgi:phosphatidylinositol alpha-mannosyltransferase
MLLVALILLAGALVVFVGRTRLQRTAHALVTASPGWVVFALALMASSLLLRAASWRAALRAALPEETIRWMPVARATMIGVMGSAVFPGRVGEPTRVIVLARRLEGRTRSLLPVVAGTVFSQTLINLLALALLATVTFTRVPLFAGHSSALGAVLGVPLIIAAMVLAGPRMMRLGQRSPSGRIRAASSALSSLLVLARRGLFVFARPKHGAAAVASQLSAWALQWLSCYAIMLALGLHLHDGLIAAAAILLAVNVSAVVPVTPSNVGVFQAACLVVLAAYGVGAGTALAYGIILQAVEVLTALGLGIPALLGEGMTWRDIRPGVRDEGQLAADERAQ